MMKMNKIKKMMKTNLMKINKINKVKENKIIEMKVLYKKRKINYYLQKIHKYKI